MSDKMYTVQVSHYCKECSSLISKRPFQVTDKHLENLIHDGQEAIWIAMEKEIIETGVVAFWRKEALCQLCNPHI